MRLGILYVCTGKYKIFWKKFYLSAEQNLMQGIPCTCEYFVFTDSPSIYGEDENSHIHRIYQENLGWPDNTFMRFHMFLKVEKDLREQTDYLYYFNANMVIIRPVGLAFLPQGEGDGLVGTLHPAFYDKTNQEYPYERRKESAAYIPESEGTSYYQGSLSGGRTDAYLELCHTLQERTDQDKAKGIIPVWHDESMINRYFFDNPPQIILSPAYSFPVSWDMPFEPIVVLLDKNRLEYGGHSFLRSNKIYSMSNMKTILKRILKSKVICVEMQGGLGNQLFQYAFYLALKKYNPESIVKLFYYEQKAISEHNGIELADDFVDLYIPIKKRRARNKIKMKTFVRFMHVEYVSSYLCGKYTEYTGCWQRLCYVNETRDELRANLIFEPFQDEKNKQLASLLIQTNDTVFIHIRRGDYLAAGHDQLFRDVSGTSSYYDEAVSFMQQQCSRPYFVIFSDDIDWCKENLHIDTDFCCFVDWNRGKDSFQDMHLMSLCKHAITANSTFSWWGAWLINNPDKIVITPNRWFVSKDTAEIIDIPDDWIRF